MQCKDAMKSRVLTCRVNDSAARCAAIMAEHGIGFLPVVDDDNRVVGVVTDRDLVVRVMGKQLPANTQIEKIMSRSVVGCSLDDSLQTAEDLLAAARKSRLVLTDPWGRLMGVMSLADIAQHEDSARTGELLRKVTRREATGIVSHA